MCQHPLCHCDFTHKNTTIARNLFFIENSTGFISLQYSTKNSKAEQDKLRRVSIPRSHYKDYYFVPYLLYSVAITTTSPTLFTRLLSISVLMGYTYMPPTNISSPISYNIYSTTQHQLPFWISNYYLLPISTQYITGEKSVHIIFIHYHKIYNLLTISVANTTTRSTIIQDYD